MEKLEMSSIFAPPAHLVPDVGTESWPTPSVFSLPDGGSETSWDETTDEYADEYAGQTEWNESTGEAAWNELGWDETADESTDEAADEFADEATDEAADQFADEATDEAADQFADGAGELGGQAQENGEVEESELASMLAAEPLLTGQHHEGFETGLVLVPSPGNQGKGEEHWDPHNTGVPIYATGAGVRKEKLSRNFTVGELASSGGRADDRARISAELVTALQAIRDRAARPVKITSGYRSWARNVAVYRRAGKSPTLSRHCSGQAADIKIAGLNGMQIAKLALDACGEGIGVGIGGNFAHVDVRGSWAKWTYFSGDKNRKALAEIESYRRHRKSAPPRPLPPVHPGTASDVAAGRLVVNELPLLASHAGTHPDLVLKWNAMTRPSVVDVVVHLHGHTPSGYALNIAKEKEPFSGLDIANPEQPGGPARTRPTLLVLPRGNHAPRTKAGHNNQRYTFPALTQAGGLQALVAAALERFTASTGATVAVDRLILTAHSGGGAALMSILDHNNPHEIYTFDALYTDPARLIGWAQRRMAAGTGALRVIYRPGEQTARHSEAVHAALRNTASPSFRVEGTRVSHGNIPRHFGWRFLVDPSADVPDVVKLAAGSILPEAPAAEWTTVGERDEAAFTDESAYLDEALYADEGAEVEEMQSLPAMEAVEGAESVEASESFDEAGPFALEAAPFALLEAPSPRAPVCGALRGDEPKFRLGGASTKEGVAEPRTTQDPRVYGVQLWDYKVNDYALRARHLQALQILVAKIAADVRSGRFSDAGWKISVDGFASRTGNVDHNVSLSFWRMTTVARCLECLLAAAGIPPGRVTMGDQRGLGFQDAVPNVEDPRRRLVQVSVHPPGLRPPPVRPSSDRFEICFTSLKNQVQSLPIPGTAGMLGVARTTAAYRIRDIQTRQVQAYSYTGLGFMLQVPVDKIIPAGVKKRLPKPLLDMIGKLLAKVVPGGGKPGTGTCTPFGVFVFPTPDPVRIPGPVIGVRSFAGDADLMVPAPGLGNVQIRFNNSIFRLHSKALVNPDPLEVNVSRALSAKAIIGTQGTATMVGPVSHEDSSEMEAGLDVAEGIFAEH
ncbi:D-Ala-D-Ala carboxypeptidase family metallohydrolase [Pseudarthrobacter sp. PH31-O2]|uniref:D-Ala-D-Ala carboxypeptidase family metallohydrolase n=1 Tax=Pseudarthrobacter sp. PH31-O2 TaxID=3046206 RepID=UPI0024BA1D79|nr:D-Ala-D-Ala carboxypeptidase family metallohydrolase [Pseudarthrobacter sp. PH31-O2]MDJ0353909.1 D-Ala-D-Ala carboxypeptidase family metallohydrolase [Pseudarthrobacter sp. PH31-O2]